MGIKDVEVISESDTDPDCVSEAEIKRLEDAVDYLETEEKRMEAATTPTIKRLSQEEDLCPICYAYRVNAAFVPCKHRACK